LCPLPHYVFFDLSLSKDDISIPVFIFILVIVATLFKAILVFRLKVKVFISSSLGDALTVDVSAIGVPNAPNFDWNELTRYSGVVVVVIIVVIVVVAIVVVAIGVVCNALIAAWLATGVIAAPDSRRYELATIVTVVVVIVIVIVVPPIIVVVVIVVVVVAIVVIIMVVIVVVVIVVVPPVLTIVTVTTVTVELFVGGVFIRRG
jgi:hypothetical protein